jgi:hypothetical protein
VERRGRWEEGKRIQWFGSAEDQGFKDDDTGNTGNFNKPQGRTDGGRHNLASQN